MRCFKAQIAAHSGPMSKICNAEAAHLDHRIAVHDSIRASLEDGTSLVGRLHVDERLQRYAFRPRSGCANRVCRYVSSPCSAVRWFSFFPGNGPIGADSVGNAHYLDTGACYL